MAQYHVLTRVEGGGAVTLQQCIDNQQGELCVGLRQITYTVGWYNIELKQVISWRSSGSTETAGTAKVRPGLYRFAHLRNPFNRIGVGFRLNLNMFTNVVELQVPDGWEVHITDGLLSLFGLDDGLHGVWLDSGTYIGDRAVDFADIKTLQIHLGQLSTTGNYVDGAPSTLLDTVGLGRYILGDTVTVRFEQPVFKPLRNGHISELEITIRDASRNFINNRGQPISVVLEFQPIKSVK